LRSAVAAVTLTQPGHVGKNGSGVLTGHFAMQDWGFAWSDPETKFLTVPICLEYDARLDTPK